MKYKISEFFGVVLQVIGLGLFHYTNQFLISTVIFFIGTLTMLATLYGKPNLNVLETYLVVVTSLSIIILAVEAILLDSLVDLRLLILLFAIGLAAIPFYEEKKRSKSKKSKTKSNKKANKKDVDKYSSFNTLPEQKSSNNEASTRPQVMEESNDDKKQNVQINVKNEYGDVKEPDLYFVAPNGKSFHEPNCSTLTKSKREKYKTFETRKEAMKQGYKPCKLCKP